jgi:hypothetical protein
VPLWREPRMSTIGKASRVEINEKQTYIVSFEFCQLCCCSLGLCAS